MGKKPTKVPVAKQATPQVEEPLPIAEEEKPMPVIIPPAPEPEKIEPKVELNPIKLEEEKKVAETAVVVNGVHVNATPKARDVNAQSKAGLLTFEMYCSVRKIPVVNRAGMRAYTKLQTAELKEWDRAFANY